MCSNLWEKKPLRNVLAYAKLPWSHDCFALTLFMPARIPRYADTDCQMLFQCLAAG